MVKPVHVIIGIGATAVLGYLLWRYLQTTKPLTSPPQAATPAPAAPAPAPAPTPARAPAPSYTETVAPWQGFQTWGGLVGSPEPFYATQPEITPETPTPTPAPTPTITDLCQATYQANKITSDQLQLCLQCEQTLGLSGKDQNSLSTTDISNINTCIQQKTAPAASKTGCVPGCSHAICDPNWLNNVIAPYMQAIEASNQAGTFAISSQLAAQRDAYIAQLQQNKQKYDWCGWK